MIANFEFFYTYLQGLQRIPLEKANEHTFRTDIEVLLRHFERQMNATLVIHERPSLENTNFRPDFVVEKNEEPVSCIETKQIGEDLTPLFSSSQLATYRKQYDHVILTNYTDWYWFRRGEEMRSVHFCTAEDVENKNQELNERNLFAFREFLKDFFGVEVRFITTLKDFAFTLGEKASVIREYLFSTLNHQEQHTKGILYNIYESFKGNIQETVSIDTFSNAFAQTIVYGLFIARMNSENKRITLKNAKNFIAKSFRVVKELVTFFDALEHKELYTIKRMVDALLTTFNNFDSEVIFNSLSFEKWKEKLNQAEAQAAVFEEELELLELDPYIYFYEDFLEAFDPTIRKARGVYYTPPEVVRFIVRMTDDLLKKDFQKTQGFANQEVTALDFATGTGAFLLEIFKQVFDNTKIRESRDPKVLKKLVQKHILQNFYGFEYLLAPYTVAHLKLSQYLREQGYELRKSERLKVFLTNTLIKVNLETFEPDMFLPMMAQETIDSQTVKNMPVLVITGNPPYSNFQRDKDTQTKHASILKLLEDYKEGLHERKINLDDDYIKFIRFAHDKVQRAGSGIVAVITNNSYFDGVTHRKMRQSLYETFDRIYILNLHGNSLKKEGDENVFDIRVGVGIAIFEKLENPLSEKEVFYFSTKDNEINKDKEKRKFLKTNQMATVQWKKLPMIPPYYWFVEKDFSDAEYPDFWSVNKIFGTYSTGIKTKVDAIAIDFDAKKLAQRVKDILENEYSIADLSKKYGLDRKTTWEYNTSVVSIFDPTKIITYDHRPFSTKKIYYDKNFLSRSRSEVMDNFLEKENLGLIVPRQMKTNSTWYHCFISNIISDESFLAGGGDNGAGTVFPLYLYKNDEKIENITSDFCQFIEALYGQTVSAEQILAYIYAILYSPNYRKKYAEYLKIDFPKIPFVSDFQRFQKLAVLGSELIDIHLFKQKPVSNLSVKHSISQMAKVEQIKYQDEKIFVGQGNYISGIPLQVFDFQIGGYKVLDKWLKDRKGEILKKADFDRYLEIVQILDFTILQMEKIDLAWKK